MGDAAEVNIDKQLFHARLGNLVAAWKDPKKNDVFGGVSSIVVILGKTEEGPYSKSLSLHVWFLWYFWQPLRSEPDRVCCVMKTKLT